MELLLAPGLRRARMLSSLTARVSRPASKLADGEDTICLMMKTGGHLAVTQGRREGVPQVGDGVLLVYREPALCQLVDTTYIAVRVPFTAISTLARNVGAAAALRVPRDIEALSLLRAYVSNLPERIANPQLGRLSATHIYDLISLAIGATDEGREIASQRGVRAARFESIKAGTSDVSQNIRPQWRGFPRLDNPRDGSECPTDVGFRSDSSHRSKRRQSSCLQDLSAG